MSSNALVTRNPMLRNFDNLWFLVQYDKSPTMCVRKIIRASDFVSVEPVQVGNSEFNIYFLIRENGVKYLALLLFCSENKGDVLLENLLLKQLCTLLFNSQIDLSVAVDDPQLKEKLCYLVVYQRYPTSDFIGREFLFQIFSHENVRLERDQQDLDVTNVFVQDQHITCEAFLTKADFTLGNLMKYLNHIRKMRPSEIELEDMNIAHEHYTDGQCYICIVFAMCRQREAARREVFMNFQQFSKALLEQIN